MSRRSFRRPCSGWKMALGQIWTRFSRRGCEAVHLLHIEDPGGFGEQALAAILVVGTLRVLRLPTRIRTVVALGNPLTIVCGARRYVASAATTTLWRGEVNILRHISPVW